VTAQVHRQPEGHALAGLGCAGRPGLGEQGRQRSGSEEKASQGMFLVTSVLMFYETI